jgi:GTP diphosphokinase / guanosine-3',5'-bis(diphosphate) 3'-diphosphatase
MDVGLVLRALAFAAEKHRGQRRKDRDASPYINHPIALADLLVNEAGIDAAEVITAAILHDTLEDTATTRGELEAEFGADVASIVAEVTDDKSLPKAERKRRQIDHAAEVSDRAVLVKLADKICNLRDMEQSPPAGWSLERNREYFDWSKAVVDRIRDRHPQLAALFDLAYAKRP